MYRQYEDPYRLEKELKELKAQYAKLEEEGASEDELQHLHEYISELKERVNFAWQDLYEEDY